MSERANKKLYTGRVISDKMDKTIVVEFLRAFRHKKFDKIVRKTKHYKVHDEAEKARIGQRVEFYEGRRISKTKFMYLHKVLEG